MPLPSEGQLEGGRKTQVVKVRVGDRKNIKETAMQARRRDTVGGNFNVLFLKSKQ